jgi:predicted DNA-binding transcriptional regulator AlpA
VPRRWVGKLAGVHGLEPWALGNVSPDLRRTAMRYLRTPDAAAHLGVGQSTLERKRVDGTGPKFRRRGGKIITYCVDDLDAWASEQIHRSTSEPVAA